MAAIANVALSDSFNTQRVKLNRSLVRLNNFANTAAIFTYGRETTLPKMFTNILRVIKNVENTEKLSIYLNRHIDVDSSRHGPLSLRLYEISINNDRKKQHEAYDAAIISLDSRMKLWTGILKAIKA